MSKNFLKDFTIYGVGGIISRFVGIITAPIYTRILSMEDYGLLDLTMSISAIFIIFSTMEMHSGYSRSYYEAKNVNKLKRLRGSVMLFFICTYFIMLTAFYFLYDALNQWITIFDMQLLVPVIIQLLPTMIITLTLITIQFEKKPLLYSVIAIGNMLLTAGGGIFSVIFLDMGLQGILWSNAIVGIVVCFLLFAFLAKYTGFRFSVTYLKGMAFYSIPIVPAVLGTWLNNSIGRFFIAGTLSIGMLGVYSIASKVCLLIILTIGAFKQTWAPRANEFFTIKGSEPRFATALNYYLLGFSFLVVIAVSLSPLMVRILAPAEYYPAVGVIGILAVGYFWDGAKNVLGAGNNWARKTYHNSFASLTGGVINITIIYLLIEAGGIVTVAAAFTVSAIIQAWVFLYTAQKNHFIPYSNINLLITLGLLSGYSILSYFSFNAFSILTFFSIQIAGGIGMLGVMYFTFFKLSERNLIKDFLI